MKKIIIALVLLLPAVVLNFGFEEGQKGIAPNKTVRKFILGELDKACNELNALASAENRELIVHYHAARRNYKHVEFFVEYYSPREAKYFINGPLVPKHDPEQGNFVYYPQGFQRIEELLFGGDERIDTASLHHEAVQLSKQLHTLRNYYSDVVIDDGQLLELCQLQLFRLAALNLSGYDATISLSGVTESAWSVEGLQEVIAAFYPLAESLKIEKQQRQLSKELAAGKKYLSTHSDYNSFDRLRFIIKYINPLNRLLVDFHLACRLPWNTQKQALDLKQATLFGKESFNLRFFSMYYDDTLHLDLQAELGKKLFYDSGLSGDNQRSCASCHRPEKMFTDGQAFGDALNGEMKLPRNTPTLLYVAYQKSFFYDGRAYQLEQQVEDVVHNPLEMNGSLNATVDRLRGNEAYRRLFASAFAGTSDTIVTAYAIQKAITEFEKTLVLFNSRFDRYLQGETDAMNEREIHGYNLFGGKALCGSCHFFPLFNGTVPPFFNDSEFEVIGTTADSTNKKLDADAGRFSVTGIIEQQRAFKTPTLRNIELTGPYMHNGIYGSLQEVVEFYHKGGGGGMGLALENQTLPFDSLQLNNTEKEDIILFLKTLTDQPAGSGMN